MSRHGGVIPHPDCWLGLVVFIAERAEARSAQQETPATRRVEAEPASGEHPQEMSARKKQHVAFDRTHPAHDAVGSRADLARRLSSGAAVTEQFPVWSLGMDLSRAAALIVAVIPFDQVGVDFSRSPKAGQLAGARRAP